MFMKFVIALAIMFSVTAESLAAGKLVLNTGTRDPYTTDDQQGFLDQLVAEAFRRAGVEAEILVYQASARALQNANDGIDDGASLRVKGLEKKYPNLIRIPEKLIDNDFVAYSKGLDIETTGWEALADYEITYILGWQIFQNNLADHKMTIKAKDADQMLSLLQNDRVDTVLYERWQGLWRAKKLGMDITVHEPPLAKREMYMYLHKKHAGLVDKVSAALAEMKRDGSYQAIVDRTLTSLLTAN